MRRRHVRALPIAGLTARRARGMLFSRHAAGEIPSFMGLLYHTWHCSARLLRPCLQFVHNYGNAANASPSRWICGCGCVGVCITKCNTQCIMRCNTPTVLHCGTQDAACPAAVCPPWRFIPFWGMGLIFTVRPFFAPSAAACYSIQTIEVQIIEIQTTCIYI